jgi:Ni/Fe-hydrogenase subunit HybB-like protein
VMFSTMHQSALGSLFIIAPGKLHPLWYSSQIFVFFFVSAVIAGICMVIVESAISHNLFSEQFEGHHVDVDKLMLGLAKAGAVVMFAYFFLKLQGVIDNHALGLIGVGFYGKWWLLEMLGFVLAPSLMFAWGARNRKVGIVRFAAVLGVTGIVVNRLNVSFIAYNYNQAVRYWPSWMEISVSIALVVIGVLAFRWIVNRMPVFHPMKDSAPHP